MLLSMELLDLALVEPERLRPISRKEYDQMVEVGILDEDDKCELLRGAIVTMSPQGREHGGAIVWLNRVLVLALRDTYDVRPQIPFAADEWSEPEPDFAVTRKDAARDGHPTEAVLIIEVAMSSLRKDRNVKQVIYAENGVPEYWIVDVANRTIEVFTEPAVGGYKQHVVMRDGDLLRPTRLPAVEVAIADMPRYAAVTTSRT
jgi:Uma2 family endonuclease